MSKRHSLWNPTAKSFSVVTLVQVKVHLQQSLWNELRNHLTTCLITSDPIPVELLTTGINAHTISSHEVGNIVLYDLAGHKEYYSSHAAILENLMLSTPAVFAILSKMTDNLAHH